MRVGPVKRFWHVPAQAGQHEIAFFAIFALQQLQMPAIAAVAHRFQGDLLADVGRAKVMVAFLMQHRLEQGARHGGVAEFKTGRERLAEGLRENGEFISLIERFDRRQRLSVVAQLAIGGVLQDEDALLFAEAPCQLQEMFAPRQRLR